MNDIWPGQDFHMLWCSDFNRHYLLWDRDKDMHLFTAEALWKAGPLIELLADYDIEMILAKGVPTLQHMRSKRYSCPDNIICNSSMTSMVIRCDIDARACPTKTDHFPIVTILELPQERIKLKPMYDFRLTDWEDVLENLSIRLTEIPEPALLRDDESFQQAVKDLMEALQDTIRTRVKLKKPILQSQCWWNSDLDDMRKEINKLSNESYHYHAIKDHPSHRKLRRTRNKYGEEIVKVKWQH